MNEFYLIGYLLAGIVLGLIGGKLLTDLFDRKEVDDEGREDGVA